MSDTARFIVKVLSVRGVSNAKVYAMADVRLEFDGYYIDILGIQCVRLPSGGSVVNLPRYRDLDGQWRAAIALPEELKVPIGDAVLDECIAAGLARMPTRAV